MAKRIDYFCTPISGFAYLGHAALATLAKVHGAVVVPRPVDIAAVFEAIGVTTPARQHPARLRHRQTDLRRWAAHRGLPLVVEPRFWPTNPALASLCIVAASRRGENAMGLAGAMLEAVWSRELDIAHRATLARLIGEAGLDGTAVLAEAEGDACRAQVYENTCAAIDRGVLGSPTMVVGDAMIFGQDRLAFVEKALTDDLAP
jgi:2-hydroxychromene-2-carboxylate isomerase